MPKCKSVRAVYAWPPSEAWAVCEYMLEYRSPAYHKIVPFGVKLRGPADMSVIPDLSLGDTDWQKHHLCSTLLCACVRRCSHVGKKMHGECREEHGSAGCCHEHLPSAAPHDMAGWQRASQSFHVSQIQGPYSRLELFDLGWIRKMEKEGLFSPLTLPGPFYNMDTPAVHHQVWLVLWRWLSQ